MLEKVPVIIVDDHPLVREGLRAIITRNPKYSVAGEAGTGEEALKLVKSVRPQLATVDLSLPDTTGVELIKSLLMIDPALRILVVSMHSRIHHILHSFEAGATGYMVKVSAAEKLPGALEAILRGEIFMDPSVSREIVKKLVGTDPTPPAIKDPAFCSLTPREQEIMTLVAEGLSSAQIAEKLFISRKTVENHRSSIMGKLQIHSKIDLVRYAARLGLIDVDLWKE